MRVVIVGLGDIGRELAENLARRRNNELILIDADEKRCERLAGEIDALVLHGDGTDPEILKKAKLEEADALVATTHSDAINTRTWGRGSMTEEAAPAAAAKLL